MDEMSLTAVYVGYALECIRALGRPGMWDVRRVKGEVTRDMEWVAAVLIVLSAWKGLSHYDSCTSGRAGDCYPFFLHSHVALCVLVQLAGQLTNGLQL